MADNDKFLMNKEEEIADKVRNEELRIKALRDIRASEIIYTFLFKELKELKDHYKAKEEKSKINASVKPK